MDLVVENCPRCLARAGRVSRLLSMDDPPACQQVERMREGLDDRGGALADAARDVGEVS
jgi:hypothetical protein